MTVHFLIPGDPATRTGGYLYDRRITEGLRAQGCPVSLVRLDDRFPETDRAALANLGQALSRIPDGDIALLDGLVLGVAADAIRPHAQRLRVVGLVHHPLAAETGLPPERVRALAASERSALALARMVIATSRTTAQALASDYGVPPERLHVVEPGTDPAPLARGSGGTSPARLLSVGTLTPRKGHLVLLAALARLADLDWHLAVVGSSHRDAATARAVVDRVAAPDLAGRVTVTGELDAAALAAAYDAADLVVSGTYYEGFGMVFSEALARGLPIVTTAGGAVAETVPGDAGLLVEAGDADGLAWQIRRFLGDDACRRALTAGARRARETLASWDTQAAAFAALLDGVRNRAEAMP